MNENEILRRSWYKDALAQGQATETRQNLLTGEFVQFHGPKDKVAKWLEKDTPSRAWKAMCCHCMGYPDPGYREEIRKCTAGPDSETHCPGYAHRPYK